MPCRFTITEKWIHDKWFKGLSAPAKLLFIYLCENCDCAGIWEIDLEDAAQKITLSVEPTEQAFKEIERCYVTDSRFIMLVNFLYHQRNFPLNPSVNAHKGIIRHLERHPGLWELAKERWRAKNYIVHKAQKNLF